LENLLTDGSEVVNLIGWPRFIAQEDSWYSFLLEADDYNNSAGWIKLTEEKNQLSHRQSYPATFMLVA
jgi:hypothetical protein